MEQDHQRDSRPLRPRRISLGIVVLLALLLALLSSSLSGLLFYERWRNPAVGRNDLVDANRMAQQRDTNLGARLDALDARSREIDPRLIELENRIGALSDMQEELRAAMQRLDDTLAPTLLVRAEFDWVLLEVEHQLRTANQRLLLERDTPGALVLLRRADQTLADIGEPDLLPIREQIAVEIAALRAQEQPDSSGIYLHLAALIGRIDRLPLFTPGQTPTISSADLTATQGESWSSVLWHRLASLITFQAGADNSARERVAMLLQPELVRGALRLMLEQAQTMALSRKPEGFQDVLQRARDWVAAYFPTGDRETAAFQEGLTTLLEMNVHPSPPPTISGSLKLLEEFRESTTSYSGVGDTP